eukprot:GHRQ01033272.1.p1 GENE.GHRQ01033272.1~~GHRQ01033272.1.p1  ORF type:complete len:253 (+),score=102.48 GHRQ01033272.1:1112-1870(+)
MSTGVQPPANPDPLRETSRYTKVADLSHGSFGFVQLARNTETQELVAIKFIERGDRVNRYVEAEILNHRMLRHPHVIEFKEVFITSEYICIAMEFASGGSLFTYVQRAVRLKEAASRWFFQQLIIGLDYCHRRGVVNRDIKLENTLLQMVQGLPLPLLKICDFGYSKAHFMSAPKSKVRAALLDWRCCAGSWQPLELGAHIAQLSCCALPGSCAGGHMSCATVIKFSCVVERAQAAHSSCIVCRCTPLQQHA